MRKDEENRLTVSAHCWDEEFAKHPKELGNPEFFKVTQGDLASGTAVGHIDSTVVDWEKRTLLSPSYNRSSNSGTVFWTSP